MEHTMAQEARISSRIDADLKTEAEAILEELGVKPSQAITMFYTQIKRQRGLPLDLKIPNAETIAAIEEVKDPKRRKNLKSFSNVKELMDDLKS
jgi:DNA-damage-inducible protein J